ncbi:DUF6332 family protein [Streptomyces lydicus]
MRSASEDEPEAVSSKPSYQHATRDAITIEIVYSVVTGAVIAALLFFLVASPAFLWRLSGKWNEITMGAAMAVSAAGFLYRVASLLTRLKKTTKGSCSGKQ